MSVVDAIAALKKYPDQVSDEFRHQLDMAERFKAPEFEQNQHGHNVVGVDRSREFMPVERPHFLRAHARRV